MPAKPFLPFDVECYSFGRYTSHIMYLITHVGSHFLSLLCFIISFGLCNLECLLLLRVMCQVLWWNSIRQLSWILVKRHVGYREV
jgi:hypothetical protein